MLFNVCRTAATSESIAKMLSSGYCELTITTMRIPTTRSFEHLNGAHFHYNALHIPPNTLEETATSSTSFPISLYIEFIEGLATPDHARHSRIEHLL